MELTPKGSRATGRGTVKVKALRTSVGLGGLPGGGEMGAGQGRERRSLLGRSSRQGEGPEGQEGDCPKVWGERGPALGRGGQRVDTGC